MFAAIGFAFPGCTIAISCVAPRVRYSTVDPFWRHGSKEAVDHGFVEVLHILLFNAIIVVKPESPLENMQNSHSP